MLENIPAWLGRSLRKLRAGHEKLTLAQLDLGSARSLGLTSPAFGPGGRLPERFTADGIGISPPLSWSALPEGTESLALIVEDPDAPTPRPLVHAVVLDIDPMMNGLAEGAIEPDGRAIGGKNVGLNSGFAEGWLPPDPPAGHGEHDYVFQLLALGTGPTTNDPTPGRSDFLAHVTGRILAAGVLIGTYSRGEEAQIGSTNVAAATV